MDSDSQLSITIQGREIPIVRRMMRQTDLRFYMKNPRVYSIVHQDGELEPDQDEILEALSEMDHVKQLVQAIRQNKGLTDPLLVRDCDKVVLEGNSRLAAYRLLARSSPVLWGAVKCDVVVAEINDFEVKSLLASYHIIGRKSWDPFEQAGMFWRWQQEGVSLDEISKRVEEIGVSSKMIRHWIKVYSMMVKHQEIKPKRWSYYDEFVKSQYIQRAANDDPSFEKVFVQKVKSGEIAKADDVRHKVAKIAKVGGKTLRGFVEKKHPLDESYDRAVAGGATDVWYSKIKKFRESLIEPEVKRELQEMPTNLKQKCIYELKRIHKTAARLVEILEKTQ